jgi:hypothetical protein
MLKRLDEIGGPSELEGVSIREIVADVLEAQNRAFLEEAVERIRVEPGNVVDLHSRKVFACNPDESGGLAGDDWSRKLSS